MLPANSSTSPLRRKTEPIDWQRVHARIAASVAMATPAENVARTLRQRAERLAKPANAQAAAATAADYVCFRLGHELYALPAAQTREAIALRDLVPLPGVPAHVRGLINVRSRIHCVVDLRRLWNAPATEGAAVESVVLVEQDGVQFGIVADEVMGVRSIPADVVRSLPPDGSLNGRHLAGFADNVILLDLTALLPDLIVNETSET